MCVFGDGVYCHPVGSGKGGGAFAPSHLGSSIGVPQASQARAVAGVGGGGTGAMAPLMVKGGGQHIFCPPPNITWALLRQGGLFGHEEPQSAHFPN